MSTNVGAVDMELLLNSNPFNQGLKNTKNNIAKSGIESSLGKIGKLAIAAFSVKAVVDFGKECLQLGSDLTEVQNVVDVTFGSLSKNVDSFAQSAIDKFGLGQTVAKKYVGTFGAMANAFNFSNKEALTMAETLTGLTGDVASFYNLSSDAAYTKLKSVFTGETETLKDLGVVMTQNALDQYALSNGYGKTTAKMTEQEKVALRYKFVLDKLSLANGDFARTQDSWANQTRILSLRFNELKATLGQGLINLFTPIVKGINWVLSKLQVLADAFKNFTTMIFGDAAGGQSNAIGDLAADANNASSAVGGIGDSAESTKKKLLGLRSIDAINNLSQSDDSSGGGANTSGLTGFTDSVMKQAESGMDKLNKKASEFMSIFKEGFSSAFGNTNFDGIKEHINELKNNLIEIWTDPEVVGSAQHWGQSMSKTLGQITGSVARIGTNLIEGLVGSVDTYIDQNKERIKEHISSMFDISSKDLELSGNLWQALGEISDVFKSDDAKQIGADLIAIFTNPLMSIQEVCSKFGHDLKGILFQPIIDNADKLKTTFSNIMGPVKTFTGTLAEAFTYVGDKWNEVYDNHIGPLMEDLKNGLSNTFGKFLDVYNEYVAPALQRMADKFNELWNTYLKPLVDSVGELIGSIADALKVFWNNVLKPVIDWIIKNVIPILVPILETIWNTVCNVFGLISNAISHVIGVIKGIIDFVVGVFTGDWDKAWKAVKSIFSTIWDGIKNMFIGVWNTIKDIFKGTIDWIKAGLSSWGKSISEVWNNIWGGIKNAVSNIWAGIKNAISSAINGVKNTISNVLNGIKSIWNNIWNGLKKTVTTVFNGIWGAIKKVINSILGGIEKMANGVINGINGMVRALNRLKFNVPDWVPLLGGKSFGFNIPQMGRISIPRLAEGGYAKANTPQLVMVGDNKTQGEIVAPEDKLETVVKKALSEQQGSGNYSEMISLLKEILKYLRTSSGDMVLKIGEIELARAVIRGMKTLQSKSDKPILDFL